MPRIPESGYSPFCAALGGHPRLAAALLDEDSEPQGHLGPKDPEFLRLAAMKALITMEQADRIPSVHLLRGPRVDHHHYSPGDRIAYR